MGLIKKKSRWTIEDDEKDYLISEEVAMGQIKKFLTYYKIDVAMWERGDDVLEKLLQYCRMGMLHFTIEDGKAKVRQVLYEHRKEKMENKDRDIYYNTISGQNKTESDGYDEKDRFSMQYALIGSMTGIGEKGIKKLKDFDLSAVECLGSLFLQI